MNDEILKIVKYKAQLEQDILTAIENFERSHSVNVTNMIYEVDCFVAVGSDTKQYNKTVDIEIKI